MKKFILLYIGPFAGDLKLTAPPVTQASLDEWAQTLGDSLVDRGTLFGPDGKSVIDRGDVTYASIPMHGYSIVQAEDIEGAAALTQGHPFLANGNQGYFEIEVMELISGDIPVSAAAPTPQPTATTP